ncbi:hypothetical protein M0654_03595 [Rhizobium sp. NTR19]|uniref:Uncharacterized protein n=1 Tax=Neorhizobium turbinariae TaxID=2937795 RepID=A0ABT0IME5_9HYPH|nr:hypothetical protein [Neorhizobium turbinariae]MCK8779063.1 hypothetical protein [Neorhizobium turbinariae]
MTNIVSFQPKQPPMGARDLVELLQTLKAFALVASAQAEKAKTLDKLIGVYANWLRRYYELSGAIGQAYQEATKDVRHRGTDADEDRIDNIVDCMTELEARINGPHPWLSLPSRRRAQERIVLILGFAATSLTKAIETAELIGKPAPRPEPGGAA